MGLVNQVFVLCWKSTYRYTFIAKRLRVSGIVKQCEKSLLLPVMRDFFAIAKFFWWLSSRVDSVLDSGAEGLGFKSQPRRCSVTVLGKLLTPIVPLFTKQQNWQQPC